MDKLKLNSFQIKMFMALLMVFDHLYYLGEIVPSNLVAVFHVLTRVVGVWFAYSAVEGFLYTHDIKKYIIRLFSWAFFMFAGNTFLSFVFQSRNILVSNNIFLTLAIGVLMLYCIKNITNNVLKCLSVGVLLTLGFVVAEGGVILLPFMLITYFTYGKNKYRNIAYIILSVILFSMSFTNYGDIVTTMLMLAYNSDFMFVFILPFLYLYNGERGNNSKFAKYFFYVFYPLHLWLIATIAWFLA